MCRHWIGGDKRSLLMIMKLNGIAISIQKTKGLKTSCWQILIWNLSPGVGFSCGMAATSYKLGTTSLDAIYLSCPWWWCLVAYLYRPPSWWTPLMGWLNFWQPWQILTRNSWTLSIDLKTCILLCYI
jgi:hypothetical protein